MVFSVGGSLESVTDQLVRLAALHSQGVLSDEEFLAAKSRILQPHEPEVAAGGSPAPVVVEVAQTRAAPPSDASAPSLRLSRESSQLMWIHAGLGSLQVMCGLAALALADTPMGEPELKLIGMGTVAFGIVQIATAVLISKRSLLGWWMGLAMSAFWLVACVFGGIVLLLAHVDKNVRADFF
jgi:hypothetical protein